MHNVEACGVSRTQTLEIKPGTDLESAGSMCVDPRIFRLWRERENLEKINVVRNIA